MFAIGFSANSYAVLILETTSCEEWIKPSSVLMHHEDKWWLLGYLGGLAAAKDIDFLRDAKPQSLFLWMDKYCKNNPKSNTMEGGDSLADELISQNKK